MMTFKESSDLIRGIVVLVIFFAIAPFLQVFFDWVGAIPAQFPIERDNPFFPVLSAMKAGINIIIGIGVIIM